MLRRFAVFLFVFQSILFLAHFFFFNTLLAAFGPVLNSCIWPLGIVLAILAASFLATSLLAFRYSSPIVRALYVPAAIWLGVFNYLFLAAIIWWLVYGFTTFLHIRISLLVSAYFLFGSALAISLYGLVNAAYPRVEHVTVRIRKLPAAWHNRTFALLSDLHLGHVRNRGFAARIVRIINRQKPQFVVIAGDLFDGTAINAERATAPFRDLKSPLGTFFTEGNHEEFRDPRPFLAAIAKAGVQILDRKNIDLEGLQLLGVPYRDATHTEHMRSVLAAMEIDRTRASILITHAPDRPAVAEEAGISLQVSGHTHGGQFFPYTWFASRIYRHCVHGLSRIGALLVYTSYGAGTWGPPLRIGTHPEIVLIRLQTLDPR
jgi:predicted MPP superfamily phosphohydrolase